MSQLTPYLKILELSEINDFEDIKQAYRRLVKKWHPDRYANNSHLKALAEEKIKEINHAYEQLKLSQENWSKVNQSSPPEITFTGRETIGKTQVKKEKVSPQYYYNLGLQSMERESHVEALEYFTLAIKLDNNYADAYRSRGHVCSLLGYENRARSDLKTAESLEWKKRQTINDEKSKQFSKQTPKPSVEVDDSYAYPAQPLDFNKGHLKAISAVLFSPDNKIIITAGLDGFIRLWSRDSQHHIISFPVYGDPVESLAIISQQNILISGHRKGTIRVWNLQTQRLFQSWNGHVGGVKVVILSPNGTQLISSGMDKTVKIWELENRKLIHTLTGFSSEVLSMSIDPLGNYFITAGLEPNIRIRSLKEKGKLIRSIRNNGGTLSLLFTPDGHHFITAGMDKVIRMWDRVTGICLKTIETHQDHLSCLAFDRETNTLFSGSWDGTIKQWDLQTETLIKNYPAHQGKVTTLALSPDGKILISGGNDSQVHLWNI